MEENDKTEALLDAVTRIHAATQMELDGFRDDGTDDGDLATTLGRILEIALAAGAKMAKKDWLEVGGVKFVRFHADGFTSILGKVHGRVILATVTRTEYNISRYDMFVKENGKDIFTATSAMGCRTCEHFVVGAIKGYLAYRAHANGWKEAAHA